MNDIWEDLISLTVIVLALAAYLMILNTLFTSQMMKDAAAEKYLRTQSIVDHLTMRWSYDTETGVLDPAKICVDCPQNTSAAVYDIRKRQKICECGSGADGTVVRQPAAVRYGYGDVAPAVIEVRITTH